MERPATSKEEPGALKAVPQKQDGAEKFASGEKGVKEEAERPLQDAAEEGTKEGEGPPERKESPMKTIAEEEERFMEEKEDTEEEENPRRESDSSTSPSEDAEDEMAKERRSLTAQDEEGKDMLSNEEDEEQEKSALRAPQHLWDQCRQKLISDGSAKVEQSRAKRKLSALPLAYLSSIAKLFNPDTSAAAATQEKKISGEEETKPGKYRPMLSRMFTFVPHEGKIKKAVLRKPTVTLGENISRTSKIISNKSSLESKGREDRTDAEMPVEPEPGDEHFRRSPESLQSKPEEGSSGSKGAEPLPQAAADATSAQPGKPKDDTLPTYPGISSSVWSMGQRISHWKMAHSRGYHAGQLTQDKIYKYKLLKHERDTKSAVPLPLQALMEEEVLAILKAILEDYQKKLGVHHPLTIQMEDTVDHLHLQLSARGTV